MRACSEVLNKITACSKQGKRNITATEEQEQRTSGQLARSISNGNRLHKGREELWDMGEDNANQGRRVLTSIRDHHAHRDTHKQAWNCYQQLAGECEELKLDAWRELERGRLGEQGLESQFSLNLRHQWGKEELCGKLTEYTYNAAQLTRRGISKHYTHGLTNLDASDYHLNYKLSGMWRKAKEVNNVQLAKIEEVNLMPLRTASH